MAIFNESVRSFSCTNDETTSAKIDVRGFSCGSFIVPASITSVAFYSALSSSDTSPAAIYSQANAALSVSTTATATVPIPKECFNVPYLVLKLTGAATGTVKVWLGTSDSALSVSTQTVALGTGTATVGATKDAGPNWTSSFGVSSAVFTSADATTAAAVTDAPTSGQKLVITDIIASSDTAMFLLFQEETSGTVIFKVFLPANGTVQITPRGKVKLATANKKLMVDASVAGNIAVTALYYSEP